MPMLALLALTTWNVHTQAMQGPEGQAKPEATENKPKTDFPPLAKVTEGFTEVKVEDGSTPFFRLWKNKEGRVLAELPKDFAAPTTRHFIAPTVSGGEQFAGLQSGDFYVYWKRYGKQLALVAENLRIKGSDDESKSSVKRIFTDKVLISVPILAMEGGNGPVIDLNYLLVNNANVFLGGGYRAQSNLVDVKRIKSFPKNIEIAYEVPMTDGQLKTLHYSISKIEGTPTYKPRKADQRIGYFQTSYSDYGKYDKNETNVYYINRWHLEKRDPNLKLSPPKQPIVFYIEHTTPVRYRRWVREGVLYWNKAFENIGISGAIEVRQQDKVTNAFMDLDPEDVRYNFVRWLNNNISTAIGPSRVNPLTGEILDADIVLTDGWIRAFEEQFSQMMPKFAMDGMTDETLAWFAQHPHWDPRIRLADPSQREFVKQQLAYQAQRAAVRGSFSPEPGSKLMGQNPMDGLIGRTTEVNGACMAAEGKAFDVAMMRMAVDMMRNGMFDDEPKKDEGKNGEKKDEKEDAEQMLDGMPESFIGPLLADLVAHEVGHTLGLRHNFKASSIHTIAEMNSGELKGKKTLAGSVMDYLPTNFKVKNGEVQGDYAMIGVGPYDMWAIEFGYTLNEKDLPKILSRVAEPELVYCTDEDTSGPDPLARRYDMGKDPLEFAEDQVELAKMQRARILKDFVKEGEAWEKARQAYMMTLGLQSKATSMMANWVGGTFVNRDKKGDPNGRTPIVVVPADTQRKALHFVIDTMFNDESFGLDPELLNHLTVDFMNSRSRFGGDGEAAWPVHDRIMGMQASTLSQLMNPTVLRRVYDNELRTPASEDAVTLNELLSTITKSIWKELDEPFKGEFSDRKPAVSSLRRNLQTEHLQRLFDLASSSTGSAAMKPIANLAAMTLSDLQDKLKSAVDSAKVDSYTRAHLNDSLKRVTRFNESIFVINNQSSSGASSALQFLFGQEGQPNQPD
jgi:hypothetical protein